MTHQVASLAKAFMAQSPDITVIVTPTGSPEGLKLVIEGTQDLAMSSRKITPQELNEAADKGVTLVESRIGSGCLVMIVHGTNPIDELSLADLRGLFNGSIVNWGRLGCGDRQVQVFIRQYPERGSAVFFKDACSGSPISARIAMWAENSA